MNSRKSRQAGFTLLELLIVAAIIVVVAAIATPTIMTAIASSRLSSATSAVHGVFQDARIRSVRDNRFYTVNSAVEDGRVVVYVDANNNNTLDATERNMLAVLPDGIALARAGAPATFAGATAGLPSFNSRGLPCTPAGAVCNPNAGGYVIYVQQARALGQTGWGAVNVSSTGRARAWTWSDTQWY